jgi:hypothetical protein
MGGYTGATAETTDGEEEPFDCARTTRADTAIARIGMTSLKDLMWFLPPSEDVEAERLS